MKKAASFEGSKIFKSVFVKVARLKLESFDYPSNLPYLILNELWRHERRAFTGVNKSDVHFDLATQFSEALDYVNEYYAEEKTKRTVFGHEIESNEKTTRIGCLTFNNDRLSDLANAVFAFNEEGSGCYVLKLEVAGIGIRQRVDLKGLKVIRDSITEARLEASREREDRILCELPPFPSFPPRGCCFVPPSL